MAAAIQAQQLTPLMQRANALLLQFVEDQKQRPEHAWESLVDLRELLDQLQRVYPAKAFRQQRC